MFDIRKLEEKLLDSATRKSKINLDELLSDEFIEFASSGKIYNKQQTIENLLNEDPTIFSLRDFNVKQLDENFVLCTYTASKNRMNKDKFESLRSSIWKKSNGKWQMIFHQGTQKT